MARVYVSLPLTGPTRHAGRDLLRGVELAAGEVDLVVLDSFGEYRDAIATANARRATADAQALAYIGDFHSSQVWAAASLLSAAGLLQVAPVATFSGLHGDTLVRLMPDDGALAHGIADWLHGADVRRLLVIHDHDEGYGVPVGAMCEQAARERGIAVRSEPVGSHEVDGLDAVLYVGVAGSGAAQLWSELHAANPGMWLLGTDGIAVAWLARELEPSAAERTRFFTAQRAPWAFYGYEAMALVLATGGDVGAARATRDRDSPLGRYSIDADGLTTLAADGRLAVVGGELVWDGYAAQPW